MINKLMIKGKVFDKILLGIFIFYILYFLIGLILGLSYLTIFTNSFFLYFFIVLCRFIYKIAKSKIHLIIKIFYSMLLLGTLFLSIFIVVFTMTEDSFRYSNEKIIIINEASSLFSCEVKLYKSKFLIYKKPLNIPVEFFNNHINTDNYELPNDINNYL